MNEKTRNKINERSLFVNASTKVKEARNITYMSNLYQFDCLKWFLKGRENTMSNFPKDVISLNPVVKLTSLFWKHYNSMETPLIPPLLINVSLHQASDKKTNYFNDFFASQCHTVKDNNTLPHDVIKVSNVRL